MRADELIGNYVKSGMKVLDVGGAGGISIYATHVLDQMSYAFWLENWFPKDTRGITIAPENYVTKDICDRSPWPFPDKFFDFVICSHTLEDIRDPIWVCGEMSRVGKAGYVETPSPLLELTKGMNGGQNWVGYCHHRWLIWVENQTLSMRYKPHFIHNSRHFHFPAKYQKRWFAEEKAYTVFCGIMFVMPKK